MLIEFTKEAINKLNNYSHPLDSAWHNTNAILRSMVDYLHIVYLDRESIEKLLTYELIDRDNKILLTWLKNHFLDLSAIKKIVHEQVLITDGEEGVIVENSVRKYKLSLTREYKFLATRLLTENELDYSFYMNVSNFMDTKPNQCDVCLENVSFHGGNVGSSMLTTNNDKYFFLCIVDSDKKNKGSLVGSTCHKAMETISQLRFKNLPNNLLVPEAREKENLFPFTIYLKWATEERGWIEVILENCTEEMMRYVDIKDGLKGDWDPEVINEDDFLKKCDSKRLLQRKKIFGKKKYIVEGIGKNYLDEVSREFFGDENYKNIQRITNRKKVFGKQEYILIEWEKIAQCMFDFGCCMSKKIKYSA